MQILNGNVLSGIDNTFRIQNIHIKNGKIKALDNNITDDEIIDASGLYVIPGFIDTHIHGCVGVEFASEKEDFTSARKWLASQGITAFAATVRALPIHRIIEAEKNIVNESKREVIGAKLKGINLEGPFISLSKSGVMNPPDIQCDAVQIEILAREAEGLLKLMTLAPERENAKDAITEALAQGIKISLGHTEATYSQAMSAINSGASRATHIFNAMRPLYHRETGVLGAVLTDDRINCEMICDLVHLDAPAIKLVYKAKGCENITLVSDTGYMSGLGDGEYIVDNRLRIVKDGVCRNPDGRIAGSCVSMLAGAKNLLSLGIPLEEISVMASLNPAKALDIQEETGSIKIGKSADLIICDKALNIKSVIIDGKRI